MGRSIIMASAALSLLLAACASTDAPGPGPDGGPDAGPDGGGSGPGRIYAATTAISNQSGKILLVMAGNARACASISSNSFSLSPTAMTGMPQSDPCGGATAEVTFDAGPQAVVFGVYVGGQQTPDKSTTVQVTVAGDTTATANGALLSP